MYVQATISCECGRISRLEYQNTPKEGGYVCPDCGRLMGKKAYADLRGIMATLNDWGTDVLKNATGLHEPKIRVTAITVND